MKKSFITLIEQELENTTEEESGNPPSEADIKDPVFTFEVIGDFKMSTLEKMLGDNTPALSKKAIYITINTFGLVDDEQYIELSNHLKDTLPLREGSP